MKCFVIMPYDPEFDDVYATIKSTLADVRSSSALSCARLDETRPAGRITDRLLVALRECSFCVADLTGCNPNVMWETGYAMALGKPIVAVTQELSTLPFDVRDLQSLQYDRRQLHRSLSGPLKNVVLDTVRHLQAMASDTSAEDQARLVVGLGVQVAELKVMVSQIVGAMDQRTSHAVKASRSTRLQNLEGAWFNEASRSNIYIKIVDDAVVAPYCYGSDHEVTAYYFDWREMGEYLFARFKWVHSPISGFTFLKVIGEGSMQGAWWYDHEVEQLPERPPQISGTQVIWRRTPNQRPSWATEFFARVEAGGVREFRAR